MHRNKRKMETSFAICETSACNENVIETVAELVEVTKWKYLNNVLTIKLPSDKWHTSPCLMLTFSGLLQHSSFFANRFPTSGTLAAQFRIATTSVIRS